MDFSYRHFETIDSTNVYLQKAQADKDIRGFVVSADEQTAGKGMGSNTWESKKGENLTFSLALDLSFLQAEQQFALSEAVPLAMLKTLDNILPSEKTHVKWPNDLLFETNKIAGILINSTITGSKMGISIIGIGLNVNQIQFKDWPTHPSSLRAITGKTFELMPLLHTMAQNIAGSIELMKEIASKQNDTSDWRLTFHEMHQQYLSRLFRYRTWADYEIEGNKRHLYMQGVDPFGRLHLNDAEGHNLFFDVKQVKFVL